MERQRQNRRYSIRKARISMKLAINVRRPGSCANPSRRFPALTLGKANPKLSTSCVYLRRFAFTSANGRTSPRPSKSSSTASRRSARLFHRASRRRWRLPRSRWRRGPGSSPPHRRRSGLQSTASSSFPLPGRPPLRQQGDDAATGGRIAEIRAPDHLAEARGVVRVDEDDVESEHRALGGGEARDLGPRDEEVVDRLPARAAEVDGIDGRVLGELSGLEAHRVLRGTEQGRRAGAAARVREREVPADLVRRRLSVRPELREERKREHVAL